MAGYADLEAVRQILQLENQLEEEADATDARLESLNEALSAAFDARCGRTWATGNTATTREVIAASPPSDTLVLPGPGLLSLTSVTVDPTWTGAVWVGGYPLAADEVLPVMKDMDGAYLGLRRPDGWYWHGLVRVTGVWADTSGGPPPDVVEALNFLVSSEYMAERASPESQTGPDGMSIPTRNPWRFDRVRGVIDAHKVVVV